MKRAFRALVVSTFDDESLEIQTTLARIKEILKSYEKLVGRMAVEGKSDEPTPGDDMPESTRSSLLDIRAELARLNEELAQLRHRECAQGVLEAEGLDVRDLSPEQLRLLHAQPDEQAMRTLVESWPPYVRRSRRTAPECRQFPSIDRYPTSLDEFVAAVK